MSFGLIFKDELVGFYKSKVMIALWIGLPALALILYVTSRALGAMDFGITAITAILVSNVGGLIAAIMLAVSIIHEKDEHAYDLFLIRPIKRWYFIISKFLSVYLCVIIACLLAISIGIVIDFFITGIELELFKEQLIDSLIMTLSTIAVASSFGILVGVLSPSVVVGVILTIFVGNYVISIPSLPLFFHIDNPVLIVTLIGVISTTILLLLAIILFERKEFT